MPHRIELIEVTPFYQNCRLIIDEKAKLAVICDPGGDAQELHAALEHEDLTLQTIILTHGHLDHIGGAYELSRLTGAPVIGPAAEDQFLFTHIKEQAQGLGLPACEPFMPEYVSDGQILTLLPELKLEVIATPGHTPGGVCFLCREENFLLSGDTLFAGSVGRTDFPKGSYEDLIRSVKEKLLVLPENTALLPGHGPDSDLGTEKRFNPYLN